MIRNAAFCKSKKVVFADNGLIRTFLLLPTGTGKKKEKFLAVPSVDGGIKIGLQWAYGKGELCFVFQ